MARGTSRGQGQIRGQGHIQGPGANSRTRVLWPLAKPGLNFGGQIFNSEMNPRKKRKVGGTRYEARSHGRSSPDTLAF